MFWRLPSKDSKIRSKPVICFIGGLRDIVLCIFTPYIHLHLPYWNAIIYLLTNDLGMSKASNFNRLFCSWVSELIKLSVFFIYDTLHNLSRVVSIIWQTYICTVYNMGLSFLELLAICYPSTFRYFWKRYLCIVFHWWWLTWGYIWSLKPKEIVHSETFCSLAWLFCE